MKPIEDRDVSCKACEEKELDLLMAVYAYIHISGSDFCPAAEAMKEIEPVNGIHINHRFLHSWVQKQWLEKNEVDSIRVPKPIQDSIEEEGFHITAQFRDRLQRQKDGKPPFDPEILREMKKQLGDDKKEKRIGMAYMEKIREDK